MPKSTQSQVQPRPRTANVGITIRKEGLPPCTVGNVVATFSLGDLAQNQRKIALDAKDIMPTYFDPSGFVSLRHRIMMRGYPQVKVMSFRGPKVVIVGGKSVAHCRLMACKYVEFIREKFHVDARMKDFESYNIVSNIHMKENEEDEDFAVDLEGISEDLGPRAVFNPKKIMCCRVHSEKRPKEVSLYFSTGKILITGARSEADIPELHEESCRIAKKHNKRGGSKTFKKKNILNIENINKINRNIGTMYMQLESKIDKKSKTDSINQLRRKAIGLPPRMEVNGKELQLR